MKREIKIENIDVYDDISMARVNIVVDGHKKRMKCLWRTIRMKNKSTNNRLPRGEFPLKLKPRGGYLPALVMSVSTQSTIGIIPYVHTTWENFGNDIYLLNDDESMMEKDDYRSLVMVMLEYGVNKVTVAAEEKDKLHQGMTYLLSNNNKWEDWK